MSNNSVEMRKFAEYVANYPTCKGCNGQTDSRFCESCPKGVALAPLALRARLALAEPARNCDKFNTADEMMKHYCDDAFYEEWKEWRETGECDELMLEAFMCINWLYLTDTVEKEKRNDCADVRRTD